MDPIGMICMGAIVLLFVAAAILPRVVQPDKPEDF
jgi:hypothetical protein